MSRNFPSIAAIGLAAWLAGPADSQYLRVYYPDIEQGSSTLVVSPTGTAMLIDAGSGIKSVDEGVENFINDLIDAGIVTNLEFLVATHYDEDHIGRMENVFQLVPLPANCIAYDRGDFGGTPGTFAFGDYSFAAGVVCGRVTVPVCTVIDLGGGVSAKVMTVNGEVCGGPNVSPFSGSELEENAASVALLVTFGDVDIWIGGDLTGNASFGLPNVEEPTGPQTGDVDVYTFNHHGSRSSSIPPFLADLKAEVGINQSSIENSFGHPNSIVVNDFLATPDSSGNPPIFIQQNPAKPGDTRADDSLADFIVDCDDLSLGDVAGLPATITLLSDGTSYRVHGCNLPPQSFPADAGPGTIGNYPPAIRKVTSTPRVPLATESVSVAADIEDAGAFSAEIRWTRDGVAQAPIPLSPAGGITFTGTLPAQTDGVEVTFRVAAADSSGATALSPRTGYFSGTTPIATVRQNDASGVLVPKTFGVRVRGNMLVEAGVFNNFVTQAWVQDATGGIQIFDSSIDGSIQRGDDVEWIGELEQFGGATELNIAEAVPGLNNFGHTVIGAGSVPAAQVVTVAQVGEALEGQLVRLNGIEVTAGTIPESGSGNLDISDDGGTTTVTLRIDGDTNIPGSSTPVGPFDVVGIVSQFDSFVSLTSGYQIIPRDKADLLSDQVNLPPVVISEIHADPAGDLSGDANGDGTRSATGDEFIELLNPDTVAIDISGWTLADGVGVKFTFPASTVIPAREAAVVFGGGTPTGDFGNAAFNGLVFTASGLGLNNTGDTVTLADDTGATVQQVTYGAEGGDNQSLVRDPDFSNAPFKKHTLATGAGGALFSPGTRINGQAFSLRKGQVLLTEVMYDPSGSDDTFEWIELHNVTAGAIELTDACLGWGGSDYTSGSFALDGITIPAGGTSVIGGPGSSADNGNPTYDVAQDIDPGFQNSDSTTADGVALFNVRCAQISPATVPIDAVIYGPANLNGLLDENGSAAAPDVADAPGGSSISRVDAAGAWEVLCVPSPGQPFGGGSGATGDILITEVLYNPDGSDNGLEWVELYNNGASTVDLSGFTLAWGGTSYSSAQPLSGSVAAGATFVVGGLTSSAANGNPTLDLAVDLSSDLQNGTNPGDGVALFNVPECQIDSTTVPVDAVIYGDNNASGLLDETGAANAPDVGGAPSGQSIGRVDVAGAWQVETTLNPNVFVPGGAPPPPPPPASGSLVLSEVLYDVTSGDDGFEWIELKNTGSSAVDLSTFSLAWGGSTYSNDADLTGTVQPGECFVVGGPTSDPLNANPTYDLVLNFSSDLQNSGSPGDGIALFDVPSAEVGGSTVPVDAVIYGANNNSQLIDETGAANPPEVGDAPANQSIERVDAAGSWQIQANPTPGSCAF